MQYTVMARATQRRRAPKTQTRRPRRPKKTAWPDDYKHITRRPLQSLAFLVPLILAYEVSMALTHSAMPQTPRRDLAAAQLLHWFFSLFGASWAYLPGALLVLVLLGWHIATRLPWKIRGQALIGMAGESLLLAIPLIGLNWFLARVGEGNMLQAGGPWENMLLSIGAGIYEELVFRLIVIQFLTFVFNDVMRLKQSVGVALAVILSSLFFAVSHHHPIGSDEWDAGRFAFRAAAGAYLAAVFVLRGFGLAVGAHVVYDVIAFLSANEAGA
jgi:membrane protease YdiL (CAAX protease family)